MIDADERSTGAEKSAEIEDDVKEHAKRRVLRLPSLSYFYLSPYLTCGECNSIAFINSRIVEKALVRLSEVEQRQQRRESEAEEKKNRASSDGEGEESCNEDAAHDDDQYNDSDSDGDEAEEDAEDDHETPEDALHGLELEALPRCTGCGRTHTWYVGALDLSGLIAGNAKERRRQKRLMRKCAIRLQALARGNRDRDRATRLREEKRAYEALLFRCAARIAAVFRGRMDRRAARVERGLRRIDGTHQIVMKEALRPRRGQRVFWYKRKEEIKLLHRDYRLLVERTGNDPPLHIVEKNIIEIARRVHEIECLRAARIQCRVRGMIGRKFIRQYRIECSYVLARRCAAVLPVQRAFRGWRARRELWNRRTRAAEAAIGSAYLGESVVAARARQETKLHEGVVAAYRRDVRVSRAGRTMIPGFAASVPLVLQSQRTIRRVDALQTWHRAVREEKEREVLRARERTAFCERKCEEREERLDYFAKDMARAARVEAAAQGPIRRPGVTTASFMRELEKYRRTKPSRFVAKKASSTPISASASSRSPTARSPPAKLPRRAVGARMASS